MDIQNRYLFQAMRNQYSSILIDVIILLSLYKHRSVFKGKKRYSTITLDDIEFRFRTAKNSGAVACSYFPFV